MSRQRSSQYTSKTRNHTLPPWLQLGAAQLAMASLLITIPSKPAAAASTNDFQFCADYLRRASISPELISQACSEALSPKELAKCAIRINVQTPTPANDALTACLRVRRPQDLATCAVDIGKSTRSKEALAVLDYCRRSLLPVRFSQCVIGLTREIDYSIPTALNACITAEDFPRNLTPAIAPPPSSNPTQPSNVPSSVQIPPNPTTPSTPINPINLSPNS